MLAANRDTVTRPGTLDFVVAKDNVVRAGTENCLDFLAEKSYRAVALSLRGHGLVLSGHRDRSLTIDEMHSTARAFRTAAEVFPTWVTT